MRVAIAISPNSLSPLLATDTTEGMLGRLAFDPLISVDERGNSVPILAERVPTQANGDIAQDGLSITYHLRRGVRWQDGAPFTSRDVAFTFAAIMNPANNVATRYGYSLVRSVTTPDPDRVVFHLSQPFAPAIDTFFAESDNPYPILPAHLLERYKNLNDAPFNSAPIGTGPFRVVRWVRGDRIEYAANDAYFRGKPGLHRIVVRLIPDENTEVNALASHEIDWFFAPSPNMYRRVREIPGVRSQLVDENGYDGMLINLHRPYLREILVRRALAEAIDTHSLVARFTYGSAIAATADLPQSLWAYTPDVRRYPYDPSAARADLARAGFVFDREHSAVRDGKRFALDLSYVQGYQTSRLESVAIQAYLRAVGIDVHVRPTLGAVLFAPYGMGGMLARGNYDLNLSGWTAGVDPDDSSQFLCSSVAPAGSNYTGYCSRAMDRLQSLALTRYDRPSRKRAYADIQRLEANDLPQIFFSSRRRIEAFSPDLSGFAPNSVTDSWNAFQWTISSPTTPRSLASPN